MVGLFAALLLSSIAHGRLAIPVAESGTLPRKTLKAPTKPFICVPELIVSKLWQLTFNETTSEQFTRHRSQKVRGHELCIVTMIFCEEEKAKLEIWIASKRRMHQVSCAALTSLHRIVSYLVKPEARCACQPSSGAVLYYSCTNAACEKRKKSSGKKNLRCRNYFAEKGVNARI